MTPDSAPHAYAGLDRLFHERARLGIVTSLAGRAEPIAFVELRRLCGLTDGNLNRHLQALAEAGYVELRKDQASPRGSTTCRLTELGRERFLTYLAELERALGDARRAAREAASASGALRPGTA
ncbi:MAG TPA: transcriptional regulator [Novosphingobium sp.]|nr:transcriptional regulator [Novosphingobium sp.]